MTPIPGHQKLFALLFILAIGCRAGFAAMPEKAAVASAHPLATQAGIAVLKEGGNAFDAAVATAAVLAVVEPYSAGMGGGGFWLLHDVSSKRHVVIDARETAPLAATPDMYLDSQGNPRDDKPSVNGALAAAIPGQAAAFAHITENYGQRSLAANLATAITLARDGFPVTPRYRKMAQRRLDVLRRYPASHQIFLQDSHIPAADFLIRQPALAETLNLLGQHGHAGFYDGEVAKTLVADVRAQGGIWQLEDLSAYQVRERPPVEINFGNHTIFSVPPPSSGGIALAETFNMLSLGYPQDSSEDAQVHFIAETLRRAYRDRATYLGDDDFVEVPVKRLTSMAHARHLAQTITGRATPSADLGTPATEGTSGFHTTHLSVLDAQGNRVSATLSINLTFGSGFTSPRTGILLNNEMDDFVLKPGAPNSYGLVGNGQNAIEAGKRPLSSMTPVMMENEEEVVILGTPGGSRIITMVALALLEALENDDPLSWVSRGRFHHQYLPDEISYEPGALSPETIASLKQRGHSLRALDGPYGNMQAIHWNRQNGAIQAAADPRGEGLAMVESIQARSVLPIAVTAPDWPIAPAGH